ncbi:MAG: ACT domain-containing protein [Clostridia bacterium]|nr:ACT domain-containing protein [Clostridia bacterium]MDD4048448.1 ACT domain-containing protein [Clostridia bacterium]
MCSYKNNASEIEGKRLIVTVVGEDKVGIIAGVAEILATHKVNILDISQTILQDFFTMIMIADISTSTINLLELQTLLKEKEKEIGVKIDVQNEDVFKYMHRI